MIFSRPGEDSATLLVQNDAAKLCSTKMQLPLPRGFVIAPFSTAQGRQPLILVADQIISKATDKLNWSLIQGSATSEKSNAEELVSKEEYEFQVSEAVHKMKAGNFEKVVLSRTKSVSRTAPFRAEKCFAELASSYPSAFTYLFNIPGIGTWAGATPEILLQYKDQQGETVALAGTRPIGASDLPWGQKERAEQEYVGSFIANSIHESGGKIHSKMGPETHQAGKMEHLKTTFLFYLPTENISRLLQELHPTPAVCGVPKDVAMDHIAATEKHQRSFYTGFLGPVDGNSLDLFVNLRCMRIHERELELFVGAGLTKDSDPEMEWGETELKAQTLLSVIEKI